MSKSLEKRLKAQQTEREQPQKQAGEEREGLDRAAKLIEAARNMDWQQVVLNGGPPCFHTEPWANAPFCGRAERWHGHPSVHKFVSFAELLAALSGAREQPQTHEGGELDPNDEKHSIAARLAFWKGRLIEFLAMKSERPIDPVYWDMHHERQIRDEIAALTLEAVKIQLNP